MRINYIIHAYENPLQLFRLLEALDGDGVFFIYILILNLISNPFM